MPLPDGSWISLSGSEGEDSPGSWHLYYAGMLPYEQLQGGYEARSGQAQDIRIQTSGWHSYGSRQGGIQSLFRVFRNQSHLLSQSAAGAGGKLQLQ